MTSDFTSKVANIFYVHKELICVWYEFPLNVGNEVVKAKIEERACSSLHSAIDVLRDNYKLTIEVKLEASAPELPIVEVNEWCIPRKLLPNSWKEKWGFMIIEENDHMAFRCRTQCPVWSVNWRRFSVPVSLTSQRLEGSSHLEMNLLNPFQIICLICREIRVSRNGLDNYLQPM